MSKTAALGGIALLLTGSHAFASIYCTAPTPPQMFADKPTKPVVPYCINQFSHTSSCDDFTLRSYNEEVDRYNNALEAYRSSVELYIDQLRSYLQDASDYAKCEVNNL